MFKIRNVKTCIKISGILVELEKVFAEKLQWIKIILKFVSRFVNVNKVDMSYLHNYSETSVIIS